MDADEQGRVEALTVALQAWAEAHYDARAVEEARWIDDDILRAPGEMGLLGLYVDPRHGGLGLGQTASCRMFEAISEVERRLGRLPPRVHRRAAG